MTEDYNAILDTIERDLLKQFAENEKLMEAVRKVILKEIYAQGRLKEGEAVNDRNFAFGLVMDATGNVYKKTNEELGAELRACVEGMRFLQMGFNELKKFKEVKSEDKKTNPAR